MHERALAGAGDAGDHHEHAERDVDVDVLQVVRRGATDLQRAGRRPHRLLEGGAVVEMTAGDGVAGAKALDGALVADGAAGLAGTGAEVDDVVGDRDRLRLVLDDEHRVALVPQPHEQVVHPLDVMRVQPDRRLVEHIGDVGQRGAEVADHLGALRLSARERARRAVEREVAQPDLHERVDEVLQAAQQRRHRRLVETPQPVAEVVDLHRADVGDVLPLDLRRPSRFVQPAAVALGARGERHHPVHEGADVRLQRVDVLGQERLLDRGDQTRVRQVDALDLDLGRLLVEQSVELLLGELADRLVRVEEATASEDAAVPAVHAVAGDRERTLVERLAVVVQLREVEVRDGAAALAARAHAAVVDGIANHDPLSLALVDGHRPARRAGRDVERVGNRRPDLRLPEPAEEDA